MGILEPLFPCLAIGIFRLARMKAAAVEVLNLSLVYPPVPQRSSRGVPRLMGCMACLMVVANPKSSVGDSDLL